MPNGNVGLNGNKEKEEESPFIVAEPEKPQTEETLSEEEKVKRIQLDLIKSLLSDGEIEAKMKQKIMNKAFQLDPKFEYKIDSSIQAIMTQEQTTETNGKTEYEEPDKYQKEKGVLEVECKKLKGDVFELTMKLQQQRDQAKKQFEGSVLLIFITLLEKR